MAEKTLEWLVIFFLVAFIVFIISYAYYAKGTGLFTKVADDVLRLQHRFLPSEPRKELKQDEKLPQRIIDSQQNFVQFLKSNIGPQEGNACRLGTPPMTAFDDFSIELSNLNNNINAKIIQPKGGTLFRSPEGSVALNMLTIQNAKICLVDTENFYSCYMSPQRNCAGSLYSDVDVININNKEINAPKGKGQLAKQIIKFENNKFCFIPMHSGFWTSLGCDPTKISLDNDCVLDIIREIPVCGSGISITQPDQKQKLAISEFERFVSFLMELNLQSKTQLCRKNFFFNVKSIGSGFYIYTNPNGQVDLRYNKDAGQIIKRENVNYIPYGTLSSQDYVKTHFDNYDSFKQTFVLSPAGDYSTSDLAVAVVQDESIIAVNRDNKWFLTKPNLYISGLPVCV